MTLRARKWQMFRFCSAIEPTNRCRWIYSSFPFICISFLTSDHIRSRFLGLMILLFSASML